MVDQVGDHTTSTLTTSGRGKSQDMAFTGEAQHVARKPPKQESPTAKQVVDADFGLTRKTG